MPARGEGSGRPLTRWEAGTVKLGLDNVAFTCSCPASRSSTAFTFAPLPQPQCLHALLAEATTVEAHSWANENLLLCGVRAEGLGKVLLVLPLKQWDSTSTFPCRLPLLLLLLCVFFFLQWKWNGLGLGGFQ